MKTLRLLSLLIGVLALGWSSAEAQDTAEQYRALHAAQDEAGLAELWTANPHAILVTIDKDLEASLAAWEESPSKPDSERIAALHSRALWGARVASNATGRAIYFDYASSFIGWTPSQKTAFRAGQSAYGAARKALQEEDAAAALASATRCRELAAPLGDWWGTAMGYSAEGRALKALGRLDAAMAASGQARLLYQALGLFRNEYSDLKNLLDCAIESERWQRARAACDAALELATKLGDVEGKRSLLEKRMFAEDKLGLDEAAAQTSEELEKL